MMDVDALLLQWQTAEPRRAAGGLHALAGFDYQSRVALADLAEGLVRGGDDLAAADHVFTEALSDVLRAEQSRLVCVQVKRTLSMSALKQAADEVVAIQRFLDDQEPALARSVHYEVVSAQGTALSWSAIVDAPDAPPILRKLNDGGRLRGPRIEPDPWWRAITTVWNALDNPFAFARFALERIFARRHAPGDASRIRDEIAEEFTRRRAGTPFPGRVYRPQDLDLDRAGRAPLSVGRLVTPERLLEGQYWRRERIVKLLVQEVELLRQPHVVAAREQVGVVWIQGRSGCGKSVLLVQLLDDLVRAGHRTVWLGSDVGHLDRLLRQTAVEPANRAPEFVLVDDLYDPAARDDLDLAKLGTFLESNRGCAWPVVVTCGPPEFATAFLADSKHRGFDIHFLEVPAADARDARELATWYRDRSGRAARTGPAFAQATHGNGLFVSMAVELQHGDLLQFASHFADRLEANGLTEAMRLPLALGRLYLWCPEGWFDDDARERLEKLQSSGDVSLEAIPVGRRYVRLTHPHLAAVIYDAIRVGATPLSRANDLVAAFARAVQGSNEPLLRRMLRTFCGSGVRGAPVSERLAEVDIDSLALRCGEIWREARAGILVGGPDADADVAVSWACLDASVNGLGRALGIESPLGEALLRLDAAETHWPTLWTRLAERYPHDDRVLAWARAVVADADHRRHPQWSRVWERCEPGDRRSGAWLTAGQDWLVKSDAPPDWHFVWRKLLHCETTREWAYDIGQARVRTAPERPEWAFVLQDLVEDAVRSRSGAEVGELLRRAWRWLDGREDRPEWAHVWQFLVERHERIPRELEVTESSLLELGWGWLDGRDDRPEWTYVWRLLVKRHERIPAELGVTEAALLEFGWRWLDKRGDRPEWTHVWRLLVERHERIPRELEVTESSLLELGWGWLAGRDDRPEWSHVWQLLVERHERIPRELGVTESSLLELGWGWLAGREGQSDWTHVWESLLVRARQGTGNGKAFALGEIVSRGWEWIEAHPRAADAPVVWSKLAPSLDALVPDQRAAFMDWGRDWLGRSANRRSPSFGWIAEGLIDLGATDDRTLDSMDPWLLTTRHPSGPIIAAKRIAANPDSSGARQLAGRLLGGMKEGVRLNPAFTKALVSLEGRTLEGTVAELVEQAIGPGDPASVSARLVAGPQSPPPPVGETLWAAVNGHQNYGVFASVDGWKGLMHRSTVDGGDVSPDRFPIGSRVRVRILSHTERGLSLAPADDA